MKPLFGAHVFQDVVVIVTIQTKLTLIAFI